MDESVLRAPTGGSQLQLLNLTKRFGSTLAVDDISLHVPAGTFVSLLGPSGSGKTTTLNLIAGFLHPDAGNILLDKRSIAQVPPHKRNIGMVFQSYSLFPHMTVAENVSFPLRMRSKLSRSDARKRVEDMLSLVQLAHCADRHPRQLSGGQQQRVAIARALVSFPQLLLMDEPLGALDKKLREQMQVEIKRIHRSVGTTVVYVTHDQSEALTMSDLVVVMHQSVISQVGTPRAIYEAPANAFVAEFLGDSNLLRATIVEITANRIALRLAGGEILRTVRRERPAAVGDQVLLFIRPEVISVSTTSETLDTFETLAGTVKEIGYHGDLYKLEIAVGDEILKVRITNAQIIGVEPGSRVVLSWQANSSHLLPAEKYTSQARTSPSR